MSSTWPEDNGLGNALMLFISLPAFLCFILLKSDKGNIGGGLTLWACMTVIFVLGHLVDGERPKRRRRR